MNQRDSKKTILPVPIGLFSQGNMLFILYGILTLTLCGGDAFHLVPRIIRAVRGSNDKIKRQLGIGLQISSITMTVFYIILMYIWQSTFPEIKMPAAIEAIIWISYGKDGCGYPYILWLLYSGNFIQQNKTKGRSVNDS